MTIDEAAESVWKTELRFKFWNKKGRFIVHEDWGQWMYEKKNGDAYFLPENMTGDELYSLILQCEKEGNDKPLLAVIKDSPVPDEKMRA